MYIYRFTRIGKKKTGEEIEYLAFAVSINLIFHLNFYLNFAFDFKL